MQQTNKNNLTKKMVKSIRQLNVQKIIKKRDLQDQKKHGEITIKMPAHLAAIALH